VEIVNDMGGLAEAERVVEGGEVEEADSSGGGRVSIAPKSIN
jgi:hypothetical protein